MTCAAARRLRVGGVALISVSLIGCSERPKPQDDRRVAVLPGNVSPAPTPVIRTGADLSPTATSSTPPRVVMRKTFTDPPLPPELREDGGLTPLPPRPTAVKMATVMPSRFDAAPADTKGEDRP
ncbi:hypothetical protein LPN01_08290 [Sphingomonas sp. A2-49]|uniref:hypothetical protein n=1 Tax=Sphingomonas sp. A2-49 TaxID=1391375 RepID=UPI0021CEAE28|nr:hypothetical protein [Sphingomonas sp. A2-49]MCU6454073.1 hypothetical protein [Sphingomonas sp. A2-49]